MSDKRPATDGDRLPWLGPLPDRSPAPGPRAAVRGLTILVVLLTVALTGTLSLLLLRGPDAPAPVQPAAKVDLPARPAAPPAVPAPVPPAKLAEAPAPAVKAQAPTKQVRKKSTRSAQKARVKKRRATVRHDSRPQVRVHRGTPSRATPRWPAARRGRVIQLGAYHSAGQAYNAWLGTVRDYPYLGTLPRRITPIRIGPNRTLYYRLQVATPSRRHAEPVCRVVRATRRACIVRR